ncbi:MAG: isoleucine--tRNA ligase [Pseudomonadota bacterium]
MTKDYKDTLNLPNTNFSMKANLAQREPEQLAAWQRMNLYQKIRQKNAGNKSFLLHDGPPYANGVIHIGHAVNKILKDIVLKSRTLGGYDAPFRPGWDCHGLPIELQVEKKLGRSEHIGTHAFRAACRDFAQQQIEAQKTDFIRLGILGDWENPYLTMAPKMEADTIRALAHIYKNGHIFRGFKPVYWSVVTGSALAEAEVEYQSKTSHAIDVAFPVVDIQDFWRRVSTDENSEHRSDAEVAVIIWTTTPWTLPTNQGVSVNPDFDYVVCSVNASAENKYWIVAEGLLESVQQRWTDVELTPVGRVKGKALDRLRLTHPFLDQEVRVLLGDHVTLEAGTGCVHTAPDHGIEDFQVGQRYGLLPLNLMNGQGMFAEHVPFVGGIHVYKADPVVLDVLRDRNALIHHNEFQHSYPHCWRTKTPLIFRATPQWFIGMHQNQLLSRVLEEIQRVHWVPAKGQARIHAMTETSPDWCISRQRVWGVPIPFFVHKVSGSLHPKTLEILHKVAEAVEAKGIDVWDDWQLADKYPDDADQYEKVSDTLDVWFDSGVSHYSVLRQDQTLMHAAQHVPKNSAAKNAVDKFKSAASEKTNDTPILKADLYLEGSDQHRGWFQSSLKTAVAIQGCAPYKAVLTHGFTVDQHGKKMSKSLGNVVSPQEVIKTLGADVLRLWVASTDFTEEMTVSKEILNRTTDVYRRIRNTARFLLANLHDFDPVENALPTSEWLDLDLWLLRRTQSLQVEIIAAYEHYEFLTAFQKIHHFCVMDLGGFYLDIIKDRQYTMAKNHPARRSAQNVMYQVAQAFIRWLAPVLSFTAEELHTHLHPAATEDSIFLHNWWKAPVIQPRKNLEHLDDDAWNQVIAIRGAVNKEIEKARAKGIVGGNLEVKVELIVSKELAATLAPLQHELKFIFQTSQVDVHHGFAEGNASSDADGFHIRVHKTEHIKCGRCWHYDVSVGENTEHLALCGRCITNIEGPGELRYYA